MSGYHPGFHHHHHSQAPSTLRTGEKGGPGTTDHIEHEGYSREDSGASGNSPQYDKHTTSTTEQDSGITMQANPWSRFRVHIREFAAELIGTSFLVMFGLGANCQFILTQNTGVFPSPRGDPASNVMGWASGVALGGWACGGISGGHMNPAITLSLAVFRGFPWRKVPIYWAAQLFGGIVGAGFVYALWFHAISIVEGGSNIRTSKTSNLFGTFAAPFLTNVSAFFTEFFLTAILVFMVFAMTDKRNMAPQGGTSPLLLFIVFMGITASFGSLTGFAMNPARDLGPRMLTAMVGYGKSVFTFRNQYWIWCPIMASFLGGLAGAALYDSMLFTGDESITNRPSRLSRRRNLAAPPGELPGTIAARERGEQERV